MPSRSLYSREDGDGAPEAEAEEPAQEAEVDPLEKLTTAIKDSDADTAVRSEPVSSSSSCYLRTALNCRAWVTSCAFECPAVEQ